MKKFLLSVLSSAAGVFLALAILFVMSIAVLITAGASMSSASKPTVSSGSVLRIDLKGILSERSQDSPMAMLGMEDVQPSLEQIMQAIDVAGHNKKVRGIYIKADALEASPASLQELRRALMAFRKTGKFVVSYGGTYTQGAYYLCSAASRVLVNPIGEVEWRGLGGEMMFYKDMLKKVGVNVQVVKVGAYKSAVEPFTSTEMSAANREQVTQYIGSIWGNIKREVSASRKIPVASLDTLADGYMALKSGKELLASHMVDRLAYEDEALDEVAKLVGKDDADDVDYVTPDMLAPLADSNTSGSEIAVYYATGDIVSSAEAGSMFGNAIVADDVIADMADLADDDDVSAVVLRINSGGGSAYASEQIWRAVRKLAKEKPVVVSMSDMAASGAYYMSAAADYIVAEPTTLTGSIGIFAMIPDVSGLMKDKLGLHFDGVKTNAHSDFFSMSRPFNASETAMLQGYVDRGYDLFVSRVAAGRKLSKQRVGEIAQGRVWTGEDALKIKLVDRLGNLDDAVAEAARRAGVKEYHTAHYPLLSAWWERMLDQGMQGYADTKMRSSLGELYPVASLLRDLQSRDRMQARIPFNPIIR